METGGISLSWEFSEELNLANEYALLRATLDTLPFPEPQLDNSIILGAGKSDRLALYGVDGALITTTNVPNVAARSEIGSQGLTTKTMFYGASFSIQWVALRIRDTLVKSSGKIWQFKQARNVITLGGQQFLLPTDSIYYPVTETSCEVSSQMLLKAPEYSTIGQQYGTVQPEIKASFPGNTFSIQGANNETVLLFNGLTPSCAPEVVT
jgi:hypothetical protein